MADKRITLHPAKDGFIDENTNLYPKTVVSQILDNNKLQKALIPGDGINISSNNEITCTVSTIGLVPYVGAVADLDLGNNKFKIGTANYTGTSRTEINGAEISLKTDISSLNNTVFTYDKIARTTTDGTLNLNYPSVSGNGSETLATQEFVDDGYQVKLVSGTTIKTVNGSSLLGSGDITISTSGTISIDSEISDSSTNPVQNKVIYENYVLNTTFTTTIASYVPYTGATTDLDLGGRKLFTHGGIFASSERLAAVLFDEGVYLRLFCADDKVEFSGEDTDDYDFDITWTPISDYKLHLVVPMDEINGSDTTHTIATREYINSAIANVYQIKGSDTPVNLNTLVSNTVDKSTLNGYVYNIVMPGTLTNSSSSITVDAGDNVVFLYNSGSWFWDKLAATISLSGYVPYTGATSDLNLGSHNLSTTGVINPNSNGKGIKFPSTSGFTADKTIPLTVNSIAPDANGNINVPNVSGTQLYKHSFTIETDYDSQGHDYVFDVVIVNNSSTAFSGSYDLQDLLYEDFNDGKQITYIRITNHSHFGKCTLVSDYGGQDAGGFRFVTIESDGSIYKITGSFGYQDSFHLLHDTVDTVTPL